MLSVIIPAYNAENYIINTLQGVVNQKTDFDIEILVMDNCSEDNTVEVAERFLDSNSGVDFKVIKNPQNLGLAGSINAGVKLSNPKNNLVMILHSDIVIPDNEWIKKLVPYLKDDVACVTSPVLLSKTIYNNFGFWEKALFSWEFEEEYDNSIISLNYSDGKNDIFRKDIYLKFNGYDGNTYRNSCEDVDLSIRLQNAGYRLISVPMPVYHQHSSQSTGLSTILFWKNSILSEGQGVLFRKYRFIGRWNNQLFKTLAILLLFVPDIRLMGIAYIAMIIFGSTFISMKKMNEIKVLVMMPPVKLVDYILNVYYFWKGFLTGKQRR